ncbi:MAG TPA: chemotaxis protein CheW [Alphaproteobacteria bacterium]|nr:chemotaxis protein CheW [Alphaproteobacteria bacterium]
MDDLLREFLTETTESISLLDLELVKLEQNPNDPELLSNIFRLVHTIKGTCGFLGLPRLEAVAHASENILGRVRDGELTVTPAAVSLILESLDRIKGLLSVLEQTEAEPAGEDGDLIQRLNALAEGAASAAPAAAEQSLPVVEALAPVEAEETPAMSAAPIAEPEAAPAPALVSEEALAESKPAGKSLAAEVVEAKESTVAMQSIRVGVDVLENLMTMVSELVLTRNQLLQILRSQKDTEFTTPLQRLNHVTSELQEGVMKTRMQPIGNAWSKLPRLVRDLSHELSKKIDLQMLGAETELDRQVLELIKDPLTHLVRNCADHGLEGPADRKKAGKPDTGRITLNAFHEGGHIVIEISDDGRGLPLDKIRAKALANKLATETEIAAMTDQQVMQFIFKAGFSTAAQVTSVSGRGVGMDVVRTNIEKIGGTVELKSRPGKGTSFIIKIPLTLAIVSALIVECGGERFAIPQISVLELVRAAPGSESTIERINDASVLRLRNRLLPLVSLRELLHLDDGKVDESKRSSGETFIVVTQVGNYTFGIMVDRVFDTEEIVVKPVAPILRDVGMFSGNTILGDGSVIMILDPNGIAEASGGQGHAETAHAAEELAGPATHENERVTLLVFRVGGGTPKAVPLSLIARLEEVDGKSIEFGDGRPLVQYRGKLMPLVPVDATYETKREGRQPILVFTDGSRSMGLLVDEIVDIVEERLSIEMSAKRPGVIGSAIVSGKATDIVDTGHYLIQAYPDWFGNMDRQGARAASDGKRLLLVDDSPFFRNLLAPLLSTAGYEVTTAESADQALGLCEAGRDFDVIVSDIEMPGMDGFQFAETVRKNSRWQETPLVALTSRTAPQDIDRGRQVGFTDYIAKLDREALLRTLSETTGSARGAA